MATWALLTFLSLIVPLLIASTLILRRGEILHDLPEFVPTLLWMAFWPGLAYGLARFFPPAPSGALLTVLPDPVSFAWGGLLLGVLSLPVPVRWMLLRRMAGGSRPLSEADANSSGLGQLSLALIVILAMICGARYRWVFYPDHCQVSFFHGNQRSFAYSEVEKIVPCATINGGAGPVERRHAEISLRDGTVYCVSCEGDLGVLLPGAATMEIGKDGQKSLENFLGRTIGISSSEQQTCREPAPSLLAQPFLLMLIGFIFVPVTFVFRTIRRALVGY